MITCSNRKSFVYTTPTIATMSLSDDKIIATITALRERYEELDAHFRSKPGEEYEKRIKELGQIFFYRKQWLNGQKKSPPNVQNKSPPENWGVTQDGFVFCTYPDGTTTTFDDNFRPIK